jgi:hypothetical protein
LGAAVGVAQADAAGAKGGVDGAGVDVVAVPDSGEGLSVLVEPDGVVDLAWVQTSASHGDVEAVQVEGHRVPVDPEPFRELVDRRSGSVLIGQLGDLGGGQLSAGCAMATWGVRSGLGGDITSSREAGCPFDPFRIASQ